MNKKLLFIVFVVIGLFAQNAFSQRHIQGKVVDVIDGRTIVIQVPATNNKFVAQLEFIDVPEPGQELNQTVQDHLKKLVLEKDVEFDANILLKNKIIGTLYLGEINVSLQMIRDGAAWYSLPDKELHPEAERENYQLIEAQAKLEKIGIWSVSPMKPAWIFREEREKARLEELQRSYRTVNTSATNEVKPKTVTPEEPDTKSKLGMWATVSGNNEKKYLGIDGLFSNYMVDQRVGYIYTAASNLELSDKTPENKIELRTLYAYQGDQRSIDRNAYVVGFLSDSKNYRFAKANDLTIIVDGQKFSSGKPVRFNQMTTDGAKELLLYKVDKTTLEKIVKAKNVSMKLGGVNGTINSSARELIQKLMSVAI